MKNFAKLITNLDNTNKTNDRVKYIKEYFANPEVSGEDKMWAIYLISGSSLKKHINSTELKILAAEYNEIPMWLFEESYHSVGDLAETISLINKTNTKESNKSLSEWVSYIKKLKDFTIFQKKEALFNAWNELSQNETFVFNKLLTGGFRIGVSQNLIVKALSKVSGIESAIITHKLMGQWNPESLNYEDLISQDSNLNNISQPYPFCLAYSVENDLEKLGNPEEWIAEWKWDGIRAQIIIREDQIFVWSRGEDLMTDRFPEFEILKNMIPNGTVIDGEILPYKNSQILSFNDLQTRIGRKTLSNKVLEETPVIFYIYDLLEWNGEDIRNKELSNRKEILTSLVNDFKNKNISTQNTKSPVLELGLFELNTEKDENPIIKLSEEVKFNSWEELTEIRKQSRHNLAEGLMLKRKNSAYGVGRKKGDWWKWKIDPFSIDGILVNAQKGHGRRADLYTDYTFAVWDNGKLVPFTKAYSGLDDKEIREVNKFVLENTTEKFGPVRGVKPKLVFEIGFEGIGESPRHKSGIALRFPRILRWRKDKKVNEADTLDNLKKLLSKH